MIDLKGTVCGEIVGLNVHGKGTVEMFLIGVAEPVAL
jgi:hypothetical protein